MYNTVVSLCSRLPSQESFRQALLVLLCQAGVSRRVARPGSTYQNYAATVNPNNSRVTSQRVTNQIDQIDHIPVPRFRYSRANGSLIYTVCNIQCMCTVSYWVGSVLQRCCTAKKKKKKQQQQQQQHDLHDPQHVFWNGYVPYTSCTRSYNGRYNIYRQITCMIYL